MTAPGDPSDPADGAATPPAAVPEAPPKRKRFKFEPLLAMAGLIFLGVWLVYAQRPARTEVELRPGARVVKVQVGQTRAQVEVLRTKGADEAPVHSFRVLGRGGFASEVLDEPRFRAIMGDDVADHLTGGSTVLFRAFNITSWASLVWIGVGLLGQLIFSCRFLIQWIVSERRRQSVIPEAFWWISLFGGASLFLYFIWRQDIVGVLGQSSGLVIYGRNIRLIHKQRRRAARHASGV